ncbi:insulinase family protein [Deinococcus psychrotolerans]|uniref:Insulinase family protein n=1 Tax=Deinococcus psychrotolerans TaxID=2489213 RepID=A0A3G8Y9K0_9DEIO|nr:pitrilysin family protein [Deinococcus psychrotolerans]AZI41583.1 insulinase family protein [Deinococcus psychrotolerans]
MRLLNLRTLTLSLLLLAPVAQAQSAAPTAPTTQTAPLKLPAGVQFVTSVEGISEYKLTNGLKVLLAPTASNALMTMHVTYLVGSVNEGLGEGGMAHLLEHMLFKGTPTNKDIPALLRERGANANADTHAEYTDYHATLNATKANLDFLTGLEADRMVNSLIRPEDLASELKVVINEFDNGENNPGNLLFKATQQAAFEFHPIGRSVIGNRSEVISVPASSLKTFYQKYYQPDNAVVTLTGNFDPQYALERLGATFGKIAKPVRSGGTTLTKDYTVEPPQSGERTVSIRRVGASPLLINSYHTPAETHPDNAALSMLAAVLSEQPDGRLYQKLVASKLAVGAGMSVDSYNVPGLTSFVVSLAPDGDIAKARVALQGVLEGMAKDPITDADVTRIKTQVIAAFDRLAADPASTAEALISGLPTGDWRTFFAQRDAFLAVTPADVNRVAQTYLKASNLTAGTFYPTPKPDLVTVPIAPSVAETLKNFKPRAAQAQGENLNTAPAALEARVERLTLPSGVKAAYLKKAVQGNRVLLSLNLDFGNEASESGVRTRDAAGYIDSLLLRGSKNLSIQQLRDQLAKLNATLSISGGSTGLNLSVTSPPENLAAAMTLARTVLREPLWPESDFEDLKRGTLSNLESAKTEPNALASVALGRAFMPEGTKRGSRFYGRTFDERIEDQKALTLADVKAAYTKLWGLSSSAQLAVVGPLDKTVVESSVSQLLAGWTSSVPYQRLSSPLVIAKPQTLSIQVADKTGAVLRASQNFALKNTDPDYAPLLIAVQILGGDGLSSRLADRIRQKEGLSYSSGASISVDTDEALGSFDVSATASPKDLGKVETAIREEVARALKDGFTASEVSKVQAAIAQATAANRSDDGNLLGSLASQLYYGQTFADSAQLDARIQAVTPASALAAFKKYVDPSKLVVVKAGSF